MAATRGRRGGGAGRLPLSCTTPPGPCTGVAENVADHKPTTKQGQENELNIDVFNGDVESNTSKNISAKISVVPPLVKPDSIQGHLQPSSLQLTLQKDDAPKIAVKQELCQRNEIASPLHPRMGTVSPLRPGASSVPPRMRSQSPVWGRRCSPLTDLTSISFMTDPLSTLHWLDSTQGPLSSTPTVPLHCSPPVTPLNLSLTSGPLQIPAQPGIVQQAKASSGDSATPNVPWTPREASPLHRMFSAPSQSPNHRQMPQSDIGAPENIATNDHYRIATQLVQPALQSSMVAPQQVAQPSSAHIQQMCGTSNISAASVRSHSFHLPRGSSVLDVAAMTASCNGVVNCSMPSQLKLSSLESSTRPILQATNQAELGNTTWTTVCARPTSPIRSIRPQRVDAQPTGSMLRASRAPSSPLRTPRRSLTTSSLPTVPASPQPAISASPQPPFSTTPQPPVPTTSRPLPATARPPIPGSPQPPAPPPPVLLAPRASPQLRTQQSVPNRTAGAMSPNGPPPASPAVKAGATVPLASTIGSGPSAAGPPPVAAVSANTRFTPHPRLGGGTAASSGKPALGVRPSAGAQSPSQGRGVAQAGPPAWAYPQAHGTQRAQPPAQGQIGSASGRSPAKSKQERRQWQRGGVSTPCAPAPVAPPTDDDEDKELTSVCVKIQQKLGKLRNKTTIAL